ncbi:MAG: aminoglycoside phosphotransferase family protein [Nanoarchaeota archaeon]|nr:aminoglycoside phosphotransferase family protein [Nanoarchaeota archaeon]
MTTYEEVESLIVKKLKVKPQKISRVKEGLINEVFDVTTEKGNYILRAEPLDSIKGNRLEKFMKRFYRRKIIPNRLIVRDDSGKRIKKSYMIYEKIEGVTLNEVYEELSKEEIREVLKEAIIKARMINKIKTTGFGDIQDDFKGVESSLIEEVFDWLKNNLTLLIVNKQLESEVVSEINNLFYSNIKLFQNVKPVLVYQDLNFGNIIVKDNQFQGLIDFDGCISGDPIRTYTILYLNTIGSDYEQIVKELLNLSKRKRLKLKLYVILFILRFMRKSLEGKYDSVKNYGGLTIRQVLDKVLNKIKYRRK